MIIKKPHEIIDNIGKHLEESKDIGGRDYFLFVPKLNKEGSSAYTTNMDMKKLIKYLEALVPKLKEKITIIFILFLPLFGLSQIHQEKNVTFKMGLVPCHEVHREKGYCEVLSSTGFTWFEYIYYKYKDSKYILYIEDKDKLNEYLKLNSSIIDVQLLHEPLPDDSLLIIK